MERISDILMYSLLAGALAAAFLTRWAWARLGGRFLVACLATAVGFSAWYFTLDATGAVDHFNVDAPVIGLSWADVGSAVLAFAVGSLALGLLTEREEPACRAVGAAALARLVTMILDLLVL